jgi:hypothetical protein
MQICAATYERLDELDAGGCEDVGVAEVVWVDEVAGARDEPVRDTADSKY